MSHLTIETDCYHETCYACGLPIYIPRNIEKRLRDTGENFFCPAGHSLGFGVGENARLLKELAAERSRALALEAQRNLAEQNLDAERREAKRIRKRIEAGVCLHCNRTFSNLAAHMKTQHGPKKKAKVKEAR